MSRLNENEYSPSSGIVDVWDALFVCAAIVNERMGGWKRKGEAKLWGDGLWQMEGEEGVTLNGRHGVARHRGHLRGRTVPAAGMSNWGQLMRSPSLNHVTSARVRRFS